MTKETVLMTGATGALGKMLLPRLLDSGINVLCIVRAKNNAEAQNRVGGFKKGLRAIAGDVTEPLCGVSKGDIEVWKHEISCVLHSAASISFSEAERDATEAVNIEGVKNVLNLADVLNIHDFRQVSTTYIAGDSEVFSEDHLLLGQGWRNPYEHTKYVGETLVRAWSHAPLKRHTILRPSILVGCEDGTTPTFDAYYGYFRPIAGLADRMRQKKRRGQVLPDGVEVGHDDWVRLPIVLTGNPNSTLNLAPIDWVADMMVATMSSPQLNSSPRAVFHYAHPDPPLVTEVIKWSLEALKISGVLLADNPFQATELKKDMSPQLRKSQERLLDPVLEQYMPYTTHGTEFSCRNTMSALSNDYRDPRIIDKVFLRRLLSYAVSTNWGAGADTNVMA